MTNMMLVSVVVQQNLRSNLYKITRYLFRPVKADTTLENSLAFFYFILELLDSSLFSLRGQLHDFLFHLYILFLQLPPLASGISKNVIIY
jgi:hypothetical protein